MQVRFTVSNFGATELKQTLLSGTKMPSSYLGNPETGLEGGIRRSLSLINDMTHPSVSINSTSSDEPIERPASDLPSGSLQDVKRQILVLLVYVIYPVSVMILFAVIIVASIRFFGVRI
jgi:hypothetical protein